MRVLESLDSAGHPLDYPILSIGVFDGLHLGHQRILERLVWRAAEVGGTAMVLTFRPHPQKVISPSDAPLLLQTSRQKIELLKEKGVAVLVQMPFTRRLSLLSPAEFVESVLRDRGIREVYVGSNFRFGHRRKGDCRQLKKLAEKCDIRVEQIEQVRVGQDRISSTVIRQSLRQGHVGRAAAMLGRPYEVVGTVVRGARRGAVLGFPTANLELQNELSPALGVYVTQVQLEDRLVGSVTNIGFRPTLPLSPGSDLRPIVESHLLDFNGNLYGQSLRMRFLRRLRPEKKFASIEKLQLQIRDDVQDARRFLKEMDEDQFRAGGTHG